ncbi:cation:proton antiporter [Oligella ureolytica]|uniref:cation:proton antiporter n=1 Tax=Oligella ureolytica TaxID=90244 RepID=UPI001C6915CC|nr:cation:proton antiporter [Oligella ureolytica]
MIRNPSLKSTPNALFLSSSRDGFISFCFGGYCLSEIADPSMLGYLLVGFIAGPGLFHLIPESPSTDYLGEIGIVFLTFSIGLEFSIGKLKSMRTLLIGLGGMQVVFTILLVMGILILLGTPALWAFSVAVVLVMS